MAVKIRAAGAVKTITAARVKQSGVERPLRAIKVWDDGALRTVATFAPDLSLAISPPGVTGNAASNFPATVTTTLVTAIPTGGQSPFTYAWTFVSKSGGNTPTATSPSFASTTFKQTSVGAFDSNTAVFRCTVTDHFGTTATADVNLTFFNLGDTGTS